jgi:hypothetical protein
VSVLGDEMKASKTLEPWMSVDKSKDGFGETLGAVSFEDVNIAEVGKGSVVADHTGEAHLFTHLVVNADAKRVGERSDDDLA